MLFFVAMLFWNSPGHLLQKTTPELCYFDLRYVFWGHNDSVGRGSAVHTFEKRSKKTEIWSYNFTKTYYSTVISNCGSQLFFCFLFYRITITLNSNSKRNLHNIHHTSDTKHNTPWDWTLVKKWRKKDNRRNCRVQKMEACLAICICHNRIIFFWRSICIFLHLSHS